MVMDLEFYLSQYRSCTTMEYVMMNKIKITPGYQLSPKLGRSEMALTLTK